MTAFTRKDGLLDREFDDPAVARIAAEMRRELAAFGRDIDRLAAETPRRRIALTVDNTRWRHP